MTLRDAVELARRTAFAASGGMPIFTRHSQPPEFVSTDQELWPRGHYRGRGNDQSHAGPHDDYVGPWFGEHMRIPEKPFVRLGPRNYKRTDDRIGEEVEERIASLRQVEDVRDVEIFVHDAVVTLRGTVRTKRAKRLAEDEAADVWGVIDVINELRVDPQHVD